MGEYVEALFTALTLIFTSDIFDYCLIRLHASIMTANVITGLTNNPVVLALLSSLILLVLDCITDMAPIILIATSILMSIATPIGIDPIRFSIMVVLNCGIDLLAPPMGTVLFIGPAVSKVPIEQVAKVTAPSYLYMITTLLLITFIPAISP